MIHPAGCSKEPKHFALRGAIIAVIQAGATAATVTGMPAKSATVGGAVHASRQQYTNNEHVIVQQYIWQRTKVETYRASALAHADVVAD